MSPTIHISSSAEFRTLLTTSNVVVADFYADWCAPCKAIGPTYESLSAKYSKPKKITFTKVNVDNQQAIAQQYGVRAMPTFLIFHYGSVIETVKGANPSQLYSAVEKAVKLAGRVSAPVYSTPGHKLGGGPTARSSLAPPLDLQKFLQSIIAFIALYFTTLFSLDASAAAESSPFNIHKAAPESTRPRDGGAQAKTVGGASQSGRRLGTIADISGGN